MNIPNPLDTRSRQIVVVAHCLLNQNAKAPGVAAFPGAVEPLVELLMRHGVGIIQMPCPELVHLGPVRPLGTDTVDQYDTPAYRGVCRRIAGAVASEASAYASAGYSMFAVLGVEGSPSCSVSRVPVLEHGVRMLRPGRGLFVEALATAFSATGMRIPFIGVPEGPEAGDLEVVLGTIGEALGAKRAGVAPPVHR